jgi:hypothetical protein
MINVLIGIGIILVVVSLGLISNAIAEQLADKEFKERNKSKNEQDLS